MIWPEKLLNYAENKFRGSGGADFLGPRGIIELDEKTFPRVLPTPKVRSPDNSGDYFVYAVSKQTYISQNTYNDLKAIFKTIEFKAEDNMQRKSAKWSLFVKAYLKSEVKSEMEEVNMFGEYGIHLSEKVEWGINSKHEPRAFFISYK